MSKSEVVGQQWKQTKEVSDVNVHSRNLSREAAQINQTPGPPGRSILVMEMGACDGAFKYLTPVFPFVLIPCPLKNFQIIGFLM